MNDQPSDNQPTGGQPASSENCDEKLDSEAASETEPTHLEELMALVIETQTNDLERAVCVLGLSNSEAAQMFGVSRQAFGKWITHGAPPKRLPDVAALIDTEQLLVDMIKPDRIPMVMRRKAPKYGNKSLIEIATTESMSAMYETAYDSLNLRRVWP